MLSNTTSSGFNRVSTIAFGESRVPRHELGIQSMNDHVLYHLPTTAMDILSFWFSETSRPKWFANEPSFDGVVSARYGAVLQAAKRGELFQWRETIRGRLAEIIVLDQFSRNIHRGTATAFESDAQALVLAQEAVRDATRFELKPDEKAFLYMPFMHSESPVIHEEGVRLFSEVGLEQHLAYEEEHRRVIQRFGRFPHRNAILGRASTAEEDLYLAQDQDL